MTRRPGLWLLASCLAIPACAPAHRLPATAPIPAPVTEPVPPGPSSPPYEDAIGVSRGALESLREIARIPGMSVAVGIGDAIVWSEGFGYADVRSRAPVTPDTRFRIASVTKVLTAAAVGRLHEQGRLDLDAPVERYVPSWSGKGQTIAIRQLAGHLGGIRDYLKSDFTEKQIDDRRHASVLEALEIFKADPLVAKPGVEYRYSSFGYILLSAALESASGRSYLDLMEREVLGPTGMRRTVPNLPGEESRGMTTLYDIGAGGEVQAVPNVVPSHEWAAGGFVSTAEDLVRFGLAHLRPGFLRAETLALLFTSQRTLAGKETGVGIGWMMARDPWGRRILFHNGGQAGARSVLMIYPEAGVVVALLSNLTDTPVLVEGTAIGVAEPFLRTLAAGGGAGPASRSVAGADARGAGDAATRQAWLTGGASWLAGSYDYRVGEGEKSVRGTLRIQEEGARYGGWMTTTPGAKVERLPFVDLASRGREARGILAAPEGLLLIRLRDEQPGVSATITFHNGLKPADVPVTLARKKGQETG